MKKIITIIAILLISITSTGCIKRDNFEDIEIYTTVYPFQYITERLYGEHSTTYSIYPNGININEYELTDKQIKDYSESDLFIFNGLSKEKDYVIPMFNNNTNLKIIDTTLTMEYTNNIEELWLDPSNFLMLAQNIRNGFKEYINNHYLKNEIEENYEKLKLDVSEIDAKIKLIVESSTNPTIVVSSDLFKFLEKYNFTVISLEENDNLTEKTINDAKTLISNGQIHYIFTLKNEEINDTIKKILEETNVETLEWDTISTISENDKANKKDYLTIMNDNLELLKQELYD